MSPDAILIYRSPTGNCCAYYRGLSKATGWDSLSRLTGYTKLYPVSRDHYKHDTLVAVVNSLDDLPILYPELFI